jgi:DUF971 family protein
MSTARPRGITADRNVHLLTINWDDGHKSQFSFDGLRAVCPCVECKGGHVHMGQPPDPKLVRDSPISELDLLKVETVGAYALQFFWSDGHSTGIYTWEMLRSACPCDDCLPD